MNIKKIVGMLAVCGVSVTYATVVPDVESVEMGQDVPTRLVTIRYRLSSQPAVVTLDIETNIVVNGETMGWASIGGEHIWNAEGDVWKKVESLNGVITWRPDQSWKGPDGKGFKVDGTTYKARAKVTAWAMNNTPDYMVVDISSAAQQNTQTYYPAVEFLPGSELGQKGAITNNPSYKTSKLVMRKIMAKSVTWTMGATASETDRQTPRENTHQVMLTNNYYIGVYEITQAQWFEVFPSSTARAYFTKEASMRPMEHVSYNEIRNSATATANTAFDWPHDPNPDSFLGLLKDKTGIKFDLPSEAQWEFAARSGHGSGYWNDGSAILNTAWDLNLVKLGRFKRNGGMIGSAVPGSDCDVTNGTAVVGTYQASDWGLYDMHGNVWEWCLDWLSDDISSLRGAVNIDPESPSSPLSPGNTSALIVNRVRKGGAVDFDAGYVRPSMRAGSKPNVNSGQIWLGLRVVCVAGLE
ncbi:MAG: formylglycine-generating enzyme family protein [Kiritimatiellae bacterium]|nr:formylglycine-generating enzyme family protein [Kiritimatiellia bacterium]